MEDPMTLYEIEKVANAWSHAAATETHSMSSESLQELEAKTSMIACSSLLSLVDRSLGVGIEEAVEEVDISHTNMLDAGSKLGPTAATAEYAFVSLDLSGKHLDTVVSLSQFYTKVQELNLAHNRLTEIGSLGKLPNLLKLNVSHNKLKDCLAFVGPNHLKDADFSGNSISKIRSLAAHKNLESLNLKENFITSITGLSFCTRLTKLDLSCNKLDKTYGLSSLSSLSILILHDNNIDELNDLSSLKALVHLDLSNNQLLSLSGLENVSNLRQLQVRNNELRDVKSIENIFNLRDLIEIDLGGNALQGVDEYRLLMLHRMQQLTRLDGTPVTPVEKVAAIDLFSPLPQVRAAVDHAMHMSTWVAQDFVELSSSTPATKTSPYPIVVLSGPARKGKREVLEQLLVQKSELFDACVSCTTRPQHGNETTAHYHHVSPDTFNDMVLGGEFLQTCKIRGQLYGVTVAEFERIAKAKKIPVLVLQIEGVFIFKKTALAPVYVYVRPESAATGEYLLGEDDDDNPQQTELRLYEDMSRVKEFFNSTLNVKNNCVDDGDLQAVIELAQQIHADCWDSSRKIFR